MDIERKVVVETVMAVIGNHFVESSAARRLAEQVADELARRVTFRPRWEIQSHAPEENLRRWVRLADGSYLNISQLMDAVETLEG